MRRDSEVAAADPHADGAVDDVYARPEAPDAADYDYPYDDEDEDDGWLGFTEEDCGRWINGKLTHSCALAGTEDCDWECPLRGSL